MFCSLRCLEHTILTTGEVISDVARVLRYPRMQAIYNLTEEQIYNYVQFLRLACKLVAIEQSWNLPIRDSSDNGILQAAIIGDADVLCTFDQDFYAEDTLAFCARFGLEVCTDAELLQRLGQ